MVFAHCFVRPATQTREPTVCVCVGLVGMSQWTVLKKQYV